MKNKSISIVMAICDSDCPIILSECLSSIDDQSFFDFDVFLTSDGDLSEELIMAIQNSSLFKNNKLIFTSLPKQFSPYHCWNFGIDNSTSKYIVRMDPDDLMSINRLSTLYDYMEMNPNVDVCGSYISEFIDNPSKIIGVRKVPLSSSDIYFSLNLSNPFNHVSVILRRISLGDVRYVKHFGLVDYLFWLNLSKSNLVFANIPEILVNVRLGENFYKRRSGVKYLYSELLLCRLGLTDFQWSVIDGIRFITPRILVRLSPSFLFNFIYKFKRSFLN